MFSYAKMFEKSALATLLHFARVTLTHQPHVSALMKFYVVEILSCTNSFTNCIELSTWIWDNNKVERKCFKIEVMYKLPNSK